MHPTTCKHIKTHTQTGTYENINTNEHFYARDIQTFTIIHNYIHRHTPINTHIHIYTQTYIHANSHAHKHMHT